METRLHIDRFEAMIRLAKDAGAVVAQEMKAAVKTLTEDLVKSMGGSTEGVKLMEED